MKQESIRLPKSLSPAHPTNLVSPPSPRRRIAAKGYEDERSDGHSKRACLWRTNRHIRRCRADDGELLQLYGPHGPRRGSRADEARPRPLGLGARPALGRAPPVLL